jgi:hypothetical protein
VGNHLRLSSHRLAFSASPAPLCPFLLFLQQCSLISEREMQEPKELKKSRGHILGLDGRELLSKSLEVELLKFRNVFCRRNG